MRAYLGILFAALLALTGQSMAVARGMPNAAGEIILCTGDGFTTVAIDENGQPVERHHTCPDFALSLLAFAAAAPLALTRPEGRAEPVAHAKASRGISAEKVEPAARGPPLSFV